MIGLDYLASIALPFKTVLLHHTHLYLNLVLKNDWAQSLSEREIVSAPLELRSNYYVVSVLTAVE